VTSKNHIFHDQLLEWFNINKRSFPWREGSMDPFVSLVTELLLQRTKAEAIAAFYPQVLEHFATPAKILARERTDIVKDLSVLGLQERRTDSLLSLAREIAEKRNGTVPDDEDSLLELNGIGRYIARAVLCFAFNKPVSIVDGNVTRVFCRYFNLENKGDNRRNKHIWELGDEIISMDPARVKDINWAILDFAARVCVPRNPACETCYLREKCSFVRKD